VAVTFSGVFSAGFSTGFSIGFSASFTGAFSAGFGAAFSAVFSAGFAAGFSTGFSACFSIGFSAGGGDASPLGFAGSAGGFGGDGSSPVGAGAAAFVGSEPAGGGVATGGWGTTSATVAADEESTTAVRSARTPRPTSTPHKDHDRHHRGGYEQKNELFSVQLYFVKAVVVNVLRHNCANFSTLATGDKRQSCQRESRRASSAFASDEDGSERERAIGLRAGSREILLCR
jgi:hypothetical protein